MITILHVLTTIFVVTVQALNIRKTTDTELLGDLTIHCGDGINDMVNITYFGDISGMYPVDKTLECSSEEIMPIHHIIYNINGRDCGFKEINSTRVWSVTIRLQKGFLVTADDKVVNLACAYEHINSAVYNMSFQQDEAGIYVPSNKVNTENLLLQPYHLKDAVFDILSNILHPSPNISIDVFDEKENLITTLYSKSSVYLRFSFHSLIASAYSPPIIYSCNVTDDETEPTIKRQIIKSGCNDKYVLSTDNARTPKNVEDIMIISSESELISIPLSWTDTVDSLYFICEVMICEKQLPCKQMCPVDTSFLKTDSEKVYKIKAKSKLLNVSQDSAPKPLDNLESSKRKSHGLRIWRYLCCLNA
ncbi:uncharacterized protein LOC126815759 isoform X2 [Patella vulgata]|uniref:uncharacterized protein LOC126815759 isoform X2 n=1 Tax=Patella vulgata TaxID=6465 RepID=UPI00217F6236|nr:uncharacterized protein LOC126815759 isoform X2 [Patella vulgata]